MSKRVGLSELIQMVKSFQSPQYSTANFSKEAYQERIFNKNQGPISLDFSMLKADIYPQSGFATSFYKYLKESQPQHLFLQVKPELSIRFNEGDLSSEIKAGNFFEDQNDLQQLMKQLKHKRLTKADSTQSLPVIKEKQIFSN